MSRANWQLVQVKNIYFDITVLLTFSKCFFQGKKCSLKVLDAIRGRFAILGYINKIDLTWQGCVHSDRNIAGKYVDPSVIWMGPLDWHDREAEPSKKEGASRKWIVTGSTFAATQCSLIQKALNWPVTGTLLHYVNTYFTVYLVIAAQQTKQVLSWSFSSVI